MVQCTEENLASLSNKWLLRTGYLRGKMKLGPYLIPNTKIKARSIKVTNVKSKTSKLLEENIGE